MVVDLSHALAQSCISVFIYTCCHNHMFVQRWPIFGYTQQAFIHFVFHSYIHHPNHNHPRFTSFYPFHPSKQQCKLFILLFSQMGTSTMNFFKKPTKQKSLVR